MRPQTWSKPKPLIALAGSTVLDYVLDQFKTLSDHFDPTFIFIIGPNQGDQVREHMQRFHADKKVEYVVQEHMRGQSDALYLAREYLKGPMLMAFSDTLIETDLSFLNTETSDAITWVKPVPDPRRFGVAQADENGKVSLVVEKPQDISNNLALVGFYYFRDGASVIAAIDEQIKTNVTLKNEFFLADAVNIMLKKGANMRIQRVDIWMDAGTPEALLETNRYLLENGRDNSSLYPNQQRVTIIPPVYIHENTKITDSVIGPYVSIGSECELDRVIVSNSIIEEGTAASQVILENSLLGRQVTVKGQATHLNLGDQSWLES
ncbi:MAG: nucleotidyltransferase, partial [Anaerolineaceae bacterium]|nr:nucleotidyltransferase [Anaerolineaceae bacterium]